MNNLDLQYAWISVLLIILLYGFFLAKAPSANFFLGYTVAGLGGVTVLPPFAYTYARVTVALQVVTLLWLAYQLLSLEKQKELWISFRRGGSIYLLLLGILWIKIVFDCNYYGLDSFKIESLKAAIYHVFLPLSIIFLSAVVEGSEKCIRGMIWGLCLYPCAYFVPVFIPIMIEQRLWMAMIGADRLTTYALDTINGGRMFFFGFVGFICYAMLRTRFKPIALGVALIWLFLMLLNGTRQFLLSAAILFALLFLNYGTRKQFINVAILCVLVVSLFTARNYFIYSQVMERIDANSLTMELTYAGRGEIWRDAWSEALQSPTTGVGFRNFGSYKIAENQEGELVEYKGTAHGFFQEIMVEHGFVLLALTLIAWLYLLWSHYRKIIPLKSNILLIFYFLMISFCIQETFSCGIYNAWGFHALALAPVFHALHVKRRASPVQQSTFPEPRLVLSSPVSREPGHS